LIWANNITNPTPIIIVVNVVVIIVLTITSIMDTVAALRIGYLLSAAAILVVYVIPALRDRFLVYGPRDGLAHNKRRSREQQGFHMKTLDYFASIKVPHSWFKHFYMLSMVSSAMWLQQLYTRGPMLQNVLRATSKDRPSMSFNQLVLCCMLLAIQGSRRLYESTVLTKPSTSQMWVGHYLLGLLYYAAMGVAIWIEGAKALVSTDEPLGNAIISAPSMSTFIFLPIFSFASGIQHDAHVYLSSLRKYELPSHPAFHSLISPHYTAECAIYLSLTFLAAPEGRLVNKTLLTAFIFVVIELGVSADISKRWYVQKFGADQVEYKRRMIPGIW
jgi:3-oxo-5-alpha-steroid 4-dehydrogenase 3 / polyprenol reductase